MKEKVAGGGLRILTRVLIAGLLLTACAPASSEPTPPEIAYGQDVCDACGMIIGDARYAAATLLEDGQTHKFDDIGDMVVYHMDRPDQQVAAWFVHDYESEAWIRGEAAFYVMSSEVDTPMGHGVAAFEAEADAAEMAQRLGVEALTFEELRLAIHLAVHG